MKILAESIVTKLDVAFPGDLWGYDKGYRDALEAFALALGNTIPQGLLIDALESALDAFSNNACD